MLNVSWLGHGLNLKQQKIFNFTQIKTELMKKELVVKRNGHATKQALIEHLLNTKSEIESFVKILQSPQQSIEDRIMVQYILTQSAGKTCEFLNGEGYKTANGKKYYPRDITDLIKSESENINPILLNLAGQIFDKNWKSVSRRYN